MHEAASGRAAPSPEAASARPKGACAWQYSSASATVREVQTNACGAQTDFGRIKPHEALRGQPFHHDAEQRHSRIEVWHRLRSNLRSRERSVKSAGMTVRSNAHTRDRFAEGHAHTRRGLPCTYQQRFRAEATRAPLPWSWLRPG
jgi:hypothetical protein